MHSTVKLKPSCRKWCLFFNSQKATKKKKQKTNTQLWLTLWIGKYQTNQTNKSTTLPHAAPALNLNGLLGPTKADVLPGGLFSFACTLVQRGKEGEDKSSVWYDKRQNTTIRHRPKTNHGSLSLHAQLSSSNWLTRRWTRWWKVDGSFLGRSGGPVQLDRQWHARGVLSGWFILISSHHRTEIYVHLGRVTPA